jgi:hypothetical protein
MLTGQIPFWNNNREKMFQNIINNKLSLPDNLSPQAKSLITLVIFNYTFIIQALRKRPGKKTRNLKRSIRN